MNLHEIYLAAQLAKNDSNSNDVDLSDYYTKSQADSLIAGKVDKVSGKSLSTNDFTDTDKSKLDGLENYDDANVKADISNVQEQIESITNQIFGLGTQIPSGADLNDYTEAGVYCCKSINEAPTLLNNPHKTSGFRLEVSYTVRIPDRFFQKIIPNVGSEGVFYTRTYDSVGWGSWYKFGGEVVTT